MTESEKLVMGVESEALLQSALLRESWRIFGIMSEFEMLEGPAAIGLGNLAMGVGQADA